VLAVYLIFNQGWGDDRVDLASEAIRLGRSLAELMPDEPEPLALHALLLLNDSRRAARVANGELVLLDDQDRSLWDHDQIEEGRRFLRRAVALRGRGPYTVQAAIFISIRPATGARSPRCTKRLPYSPARPSWK